MSDEENAKVADHILELLTKPLNRYILTVLAGIDPGTFKGPIEPFDTEENYD